MVTLWKNYLHIVYFFFLNPAEEKLRMLQSDLNSTEQKLVSAAQELKKLAPTRNTPEPFRDDKFKIRQRLAKKMQNVNIFMTQIHK